VGLQDVAKKALYSETVKAPTAIADKITEEEALMPEAKFGLSIGTDATTSMISTTSVSEKLL